MQRLRSRPDPTRATAHSARGRTPLKPGDRVAVVGAGPAGTLFARALLRFAASIRLPLSVDLFDPRPFTRGGPGGCAHCGGIVSESLVQVMAAEGLELPPHVVRRGITSYVVHTDVGRVRIESPRTEARIAALFRGNGPRGGGDEPSVSLDGYLLERALDAGARLLPRLVTGVITEHGLPLLSHPDGTRSGPYHLVALASGVNSQLVPLLAGRNTPALLRTYICEFHADAHEIERLLGCSMHVFLLDLPRLEFAALIPKGEYVTLCLLGEDVDDTLIHAFLEQPAVRACLPSESARCICQCSPLINVRSRAEPFGERLVLIGDAGVTRLYKDGIGAAFRTSKAAAETAVLFGVSADDFRRHFLPICRRIEADNAIGRTIFAGTGIFKRLRSARRAVLHMAAAEQRRPRGRRPMSNTLWNLFTGSAPYSSILAGTLHPSFIAGLVRSLVAANLMPHPEVHHDEAARTAVR
jgi:flavin-dependent dehydrogenase